jgi:glycolate oxidase iron-sulfur subunit
MQTQLSEEFKGTSDGEAAEAILRKCVHCGFCAATCPTYQLLGDELDGPRGRIYLIKETLEGRQPTRETQLHLDRCLTCRNCETTCPSGVQYGELIEIGRRVVDAKVPRPAGERAQRWMLKEGLTSPLFGPAMKLGQAVRPMVPASLRDKIPASAQSAVRRAPRGTHASKMLLLQGCVQPSMMPGINAATANVLDAAGIELVAAEGAGCCGAIRSHLSDHEGGIDDMRRNIDAWWPQVESKSVEAIVTNASGCGVMVKDYGRYLQHDARYATRAAAVSALAVDLGELLPRIVPRIASRLKPLAASPRGSLVFHPPCTLQHGQQLRGGIETGLRALGFDVQLAAAESHLCCGSAGTYSVTQPELARALRDRKLSGLLEAGEPDAIVSANIGCIQHLQSGTKLPVRHWVQVVDEALG